MDALDKPPDATAPSIQASLLALTIEDVCRTLFRHALLQCGSAIVGSSASKIEIAINYEMWTVTVTFELDRSSICALSTEATRLSIDDKELRSMSYLGLIQLTVSFSSGTSEYIWQDGQRTHCTSSSKPLGDPSSSITAAWTRGVRISMRNVFSSMPVRRKLVASEASERGAVHKLLSCVRGLSLLVPQSSIRLVVRHAACDVDRAPANRVLLSLPGGKDLIHRCHAAFGDAFVADSTRVVAEERTIGPLTMKIAGFAGSAASPEAAIRVIFLQASVWPGAMIRGALQQSERMSAVFASLLSGLGLPWTDEVDGRCGAQVGLSPRMYDKVRQKIEARASQGGYLHAAITFVLNVSLYYTHADGHVEATSSSGSTLTVESFEAALLDAIGGQLHVEHGTTSRKRKRSSRPSTAGDVEAKADPIKTFRARPATASLALESYGPAAAVPKGMIEWRHPVSGRVFHIDQRTGHSVPVGPRSMTNGDDGISASTKPRGLNGGIGVDRTQLKRSLTLLIPNRRIQPEGDTDEFDDPSFDAALAAIPSPSPVARSDLMQRSRFFDTCRSSSPVKASANGRLSRDDSDVGSMPGRMNVVALAITRSDLQTAHVLNQVDGKFILCSTSSTSSKTNGVVFCIDQHAADERYRLERLLEQYVDDCAAGAAVYQLASTFTLSVSVQQYDLIKGTPAVESNMKTLGWSIKAVVLIHPTLGHAQVDLDGIPSILRDKALTDRGKVKDQSLLQKCFASCLDSSHRLFEVRSGEDWLAAWRRLPGELLEVLKSTACRGAIMFNDVLEREACERLVRRLAGCRFPFGCAHGRVALVPLCEVRGRVEGEIG